MLTNTIFEDAVERILDVGQRFASALEAADIPYRVVGGLAVFLHIDPVDPMAARLTKDVDVAVSREHLEAIRAAVAPCGFTFRHVTGVDMFVDAENPGAGGAVHLTFVAVPASEAVRTPKGLLIAPVGDLVRMKLTSYRLRDQVHIQDLDAAGLITPEIEKTLPELLLRRLQEIRSKE